VNDVDLLEKWRAGDIDAGDELFRRHIEMLYRFFCTKISGGVDDLVQQTLIACLENHHSFEQRSSFRAFLLGVARFQLYSHYRNIKRDNARLEFDTVTILDLDPSPSMHAAESAEHRLLLEALRRLPVNLQIALELSYWEDMSAPELAEALGVPTDTVYSRLRRARELLARQLKRLSGRALAPTENNLETWAVSLREQLARTAHSFDADEPKAL
jgi:RNA polymerase sigma-70 factor (ECF subfamily)